MLEAISTGVSTALQCCGKVLGAIAHETGQLKYVLPVIGLAIGLGIVGWGIKTVKSLVWGM